MLELNDPNPTRICSYGKRTCFIKNHVFYCSLNSEGWKATDPEKKRLRERYCEWFVSTELFL